MEKEWKPGLYSGSIDPIWIYKGRKEKMGTTYLSLGLCKAYLESLGYKQDM